MVMNYFFVRSFGVFVMDVPKNYRNLIVFRAVIGFFGIQGMFQSVKYLPVSTASCIFFTLPIWSAVGAFVVLKEKLSVYDIICICGAFLGCVIINNPFEDKLQTSTDNVVDDGSHGLQDYKIYTPSDKLWGTFYALTGSVGGACALICMRIMRKDIHYTISPFWFSIGCTFMSPILGVN